MWIYRSRSSSRIPDAPSVLGSSEQVRFNQTSETVCTDGRVPDEIQERVSGCGAGNWKGPTAVSVEPVARYCKQLTVGGTQVPPSVSTGGQTAVVRQPFRLWWTVIASLKNTSQRSSLCSIWPSLWSNVQVPVTTRTAVFNTRCNLSITVLSAPARTVL